MGEGGQAIKLFYEKLTTTNVTSVIAPQYHRVRAVYLQLLNPYISPCEAANY